ncbi:MAG: lauroyl-Kdo(2)-lipid IV(A) myristoyltransferase [Aeromonas sp.]
MTARDPVFDTSFHKGLLHPRLWGSWCALALLALLAFVPARWRDALADRLAPWLLRGSKKQAYIADTNLRLCFAQLSAAERHALLLRSIRIGLKVMLSFGELTWRSAHFLRHSVVVEGWKQVDALRARGETAIFVVPHTWAIDRVGRYFPLMGLNMCTMMKSPKNALFDWYINRERAKGGQVYERRVGIKPAIKALRAGTHFFYLPDQDHGRDASVFVPFFGQPKATLPALPKLVKLTGARALPMLASYDEARHVYRLKILPPLAPYPSEDTLEDVRAMNQVVETLLIDDPAQYMWFLKIFETQVDAASGEGRYEAGIRRIRQGLSPVA